MKLDKDQLDQFHTEGFLFLPECFSFAESQVLLEEARNVYQLDRPEVLHETSGVARTAFAATRRGPRRGRQARTSRGQ